MKTYTKPFALIAILLALLCLTFVSAGAETITGTTGDLTWTVDPDAMTLTITGNGPMPDYRLVEPNDDPDYITSPWYDYRGQFSSVIIGEGVTRVGNSAFRMTSIKSISLPNSLTSLGDFSLYTASLTSVTVPFSVTSFGKDIYYHDTEVKGLTAGGVSGSTTWQIVNDTLTVSGSIPDYGWSTPTSKYDLSHIDTPWYYYDYRVNSIVIESGVTSIGANAFYECTSATSVTIPSTVTSIGKDAFYGDYSITSVYYRLNSDESSSSWPLISFANAAANPMAASGTAKLYVNGSELTYMVLQGDVSPYAFYKCQNNFGVAASGGKLSTVGDYAFYGCKGLYEASLPTSVTHIGHYAFYGCSALDSVFCLFDGAVSIGDYAFSDCTSLTEVDMKRYANLELTYLGKYAFWNCTALESVILGDTTTLPPDCFTNCSALTSVELPDTLTEIGDRAFSGCSSLTSIDIPDSVLSIGSSAFASCTALSDLVLPDSLTTINGSAFSDCDALTAIVIPSSVQAINSSAFYYCDALASITFEGTAPTISTSAFSGVQATVTYFPGSSWSGMIQNYGGKLTWIPVGGSCGEATWQLTENGLLRISGGSTVSAGAWSAYTDRITEILLGSSVIGVESKAFAGLTNVTKIAIDGPVSQIMDDAFTGITAEVYWHQIDDILREFVDSFASPYAEGFGGTLNWRHPVCHVNNSATTYSISVQEHTINAASAVAPTCTEDGIVDHWACSCGLVFTDNDPLSCTKAEALAIPATGHTYDVSFAWSEDTSTCQGVFTCPFGDAETALDAAITSRKISDPDCLNNGETEYTARVTYEEIDPATEYTDVIILADIPALGHTEAIIPGLAPSCEEAGMMDYIFCEVCGEELQAADEIPALGHTEVVISEASAPTCTQDGRTTEIECGECGLTMQTAEILPMLGHKPEADTGYAADCLNPGLTDGSHCLTCGEILVEQEIIDALGHEPVTDPGYEATDREEGLSDGSHCQNCGEILTEQQVIPARFTFDGDTVIAYNATDPDVVIPDGVTALGPTLFKNNTAIRSVRVPDSVQTLGTQTFFGCTGLEDIWLPAHLTSIGAQTFYNVTARFHVSADSATAIALSYRSIAFTTEDGMTLRYRVTSATGTPTAVWVVGYSGSEAWVTIPETVNNTPVTQILADAFKGQSQLTRVTIPECVDTIGDAAFDAAVTICCNKGSAAETWAQENGNPIEYLDAALAVDYQYTITDGTVTITKYTGDDEILVIPDTLEGYPVVAIGDYAFYCLDFTTSITVPEGLISIGNFAFADCYSLRQVSLPDSITSMGEGVFSQCSNLSSVNIPSGLTSINRYVFDGCVSIVIIDIPEGITSIGDGAFHACYSLTQITLPDSLTTIGEMAFYECGKLQDFTIPASVTSIGLETFFGCTSLTSVVLPEAMTSISDDLFNGCIFLTDVVIPETVTSIGMEAFAECPRLARITVPASIATIGDYAFTATTTICCYRKSAADVWAQQNGNPIEYLDAVISGTCGDNLIWTLDAEGLLTISGTGAMTDYNEGPLSPWGTDIQRVVIQPGVTTIGCNAFLRCASLTDIAIPEGVTYIGGSAFFGCTSLTSITLPETVTSIDPGAFFGCASLKEINLPSGLTGINEDTFNGCTSLTSITIPESVKVIGEAAFSTTVTICCYRNSAAEAWAQQNGNPIEYLDAPEAVEFMYTITDGVATITGGRTGYTEALVIPDTLEGCPVVAIGEYAFNDCVSLPDITIPETVTSIGDYAFAYCQSLSSITLPANVTSIGSYAFEGCTSLTSITIPESVKHFGDYPFNMCDQLVAHVKWGTYAYQWCAENNIPTQTIDSIPLIPADCIRPNASATADVISKVTAGRVTYICQPGDEVTTMIPAPEAAATYSLCANGYDPFSDRKMLNNGGALLNTLDFPMDAETTRLLCWYDENDMLLGGGEITIQYRSNLLTMRLPASLITIDEEAFLGSGMQRVIISDGCESIGAKAFASCTALVVVQMTSSVEFIAEDAFDGCSELIFVCPADSTAAVYAQAHGIYWQTP